MSDIRFGTGGWRAVIGDDFIRENISKVAQSISEMLIEDNKTDKPVMIGYDRRFLSEAGARWLAEVFSANGIKVLMMKRSAPSPLIMHTVMKKGLYCGIEVTASHNPPEYDGIKVIVEEGRDAPVEVTDRIEAGIDSLKGIRRQDFQTAVGKGDVEFVRNPFNDFIDDILAVIDKDAIKQRGLRVLFDPMHGSGTYPLEVILNTCRCTLDVINENKDAYFDGGYPAPSEETLGYLSDRVVRGGYDFGIAFDGDGDRLGIIDSDGRYVSMNEIIVMLYWYLHEKKGWKGPVVRNISTTYILDRMAKSFGEQCIEVPVGFKWVSAAIDEYNAVLGGESSGGLTVRGHINGKDAIYTVSLFVEMLSVTGLTVKEIADLIAQRWGRSVFVDEALRFKPEDKILINDVVIRDRKIPSFDKPVSRISYLDGCKVFFEDDSYVICRFSGTEPLLRIMAESGSRDEAKALADTFVEFIRGITGA